ncbi:transcriptional regulator family: Fungal Specific TF [Penicillium alfredii]|uniref:Transcriptional regulator family: Fungal Specific TF n=1 Tax=Penicillium alfredii TaxID=1506179 RepID=A0A9W9FRV4_9EURO|nr:transcriptional regulator family: Fungal Specific TF [Penicillium alfredii]KAJ5105291.1 transcriptional regulator family: Fungal Specific TF [Penicillium alfredii]
MDPADGADALETQASLPTLFVDSVFGCAEEQSAWEYYVRLVSSNVPALDGPDNPYRQLSITALSSPVLLHTILCIATEHMLNFGFGSVSLAAKRQQRMLRTIGQKLLGVHAGDPNAGAIVDYHNHEHEALLAAVVLQGIVVAQTPDGVLEPHVKCASFLLQTLGFFQNIPQNPLTRMAVQRFAMVDLMLAISRQRRPYAPGDFIIYQPDPTRWDTIEPSFHKMTGCPQPLMCFLVRISHLACDVDERHEHGTATNDILTEALRLDSELRAWGCQYTGNIPQDELRAPLDILTECFYWTAHLLLARRVFRDATCSLRVQHLAHTCFGLMDHLSTGCGPDSSLPQPFYLAAREAITLQDRNWVRRKHASMTAYYREPQRNLAMELTERIWDTTDGLRGLGPDAVTANDESALSMADGYIKALDRESCLFIF